MASRQRTSGSSLTSTKLGVCLPTPPHSEPVRSIPVAGSTFVVAANGFADGPAQPLRDHLLDRGAEVVVEISHPLVPEGPTTHRITIYRSDGTISGRGIDLHLRP